MEEKDTCRWWRLAHHRLPLKYNGTHSTAGYECTRPTWCKHNTTDERMGGCLLRGDLIGIPEEERP